MPIRTPPGTSVETLLLDRMESDRPGDWNLLARDIANLLGARKAFRGRAPSVLGWGLPGMSGLSPNSDAHRRRIAGMIAAAIERFEYRLTDVSVNPVENTSDFVFELQGRLRNAGKSGAVLLRILAPHRGGALSADVELVELNTADDHG